jgi:hypothetical protein
MRLVLVRKPVQRAEPGRVIREGSTGRVVTVLPQVWAVEETLPDPTHAQKARMNGAPGVYAAPVPCDPTYAQEARMNGAACGVEAPKVEVAFYRKYTEAMLRRYLRLSMQAGRVPSLLGRELFRGHVTSYRVHSFEDVVIFCFDMEKCLGKLERLDQQLIKRIALQQYTQGEAASMLGLSLRSCIRRYGEGLDRLTELLLAARMLEPMKDCQETRPRSAVVGGSFQRR